MTAGEFIQVGMEEGDIELLLEYAKPSNTYAGVTCKPLFEMKWGEVMELGKMYSDGEVVECIMMFTGLKLKKILKQPHTDFMYFWRWMHTEFQSLQRRQEALQGDTDPNLIEAGIEDLSKYGFINALDALAKGDVTKWDEVYNLPYQDCYMKQLKDKDTAEIEANYSAIMNRKNKRSNG